MMSGTMYRRSANPSLEEIVGLGTSGYANAPGPSVSSPTNQDDLQQSALFRALTTPESQGDAPVVEEKPWWAKMLMGMGDAYSAYGATLAGGSPGESSFSKYLRSQERAKADLTEWQRKTSESKREADLRGLVYLDTKKQRALEAKAAQIAEDKAAQAVRDKIKRDQETEASRRVFELDKIAKEHELDQQEQGARFKHEEGMKRLEASLKTGEDPKAEKALQSFSLGARIANGILRGVPEGKDGPAIPPLSVRLAGDRENKIAPQTPEQIRREFEDEMTQEGIFGPARDLARDYFNERMIRTVRESQKAAQPQNPGP